MSSKQHEVIYFDAAGRAEGIRICLHAAGVDFVDTRFPGSEWPSIKGTTPLGFVPVLKVDGVQHCQSVSLMRYAAKLGGFYPSDPLEALTVDEVMESLNELMASAPKTSDDDELKKLRTEYQDTKMKQYGAFVEGFIQKNGGTLVSGKTVTMADLGLSSMVKMIEKGFWTHIDPKFFEAYPGITATVKAVDEDERVKVYYKSKE